MTIHKTDSANVFFPISIYSIIIFHHSHLHLPNVLFLLVLFSLVVFLLLLLLTIIDVFL